MMVAVVVSICPEQLRGYLTRWLLEVSAGVYVGSVSARVRDEIWALIGENGQGGRAVMAYPDRNREQGFAVRCLNTDRNPVDLDGLTLMMQPVVRKDSQLKAGWSKASRLRAARRAGKM